MGVDYPPAPVRVGVKVELEVITGSVPGLVGVELVDDQQERPVITVFNQPSDGLPESPSGEPVRLGGPAPHVREAVVEVVPNAAVGEVAGQVRQVLDVSLDGDPVPVRLMPPNPLPYLEAPVEVHRWLEHVVGRREEGRRVTAVSEALRHRHLLLWYRLPAGYEDGVPLVLFVPPAWECPHPGVQSPPNGQSRQRLGVGVLEPDALLGEGVDVRGPDPVVAVAPDVVPP